MVAWENEGPGSDGETARGVLNDPRSINDTRHGVLKPHGF